MIAIAVVAILASIGVATASNKKKESTSGPTSTVAAQTSLTTLASTTAQPTSTEAPTTTAAPTTSTPTKSGVGTTKNTAGWDVTLFAVDDPYTSSNSFSQPKSGSRFVRVDIQVKNVDASSDSFSSLLAFEVDDSDNHHYKESFDSAFETPGPPDGTIAKGEASRGFVIFEMPSTSKGLKLRVKGDLFAAGSVFSLSSS